MKNILIIVYKFPPLGGVGTRRWSKFSKYLALKGYNVHVLSVDCNYIDVLNWSDDVQHENINLYNYKSKYPIWLLKEESNRYLKSFKRYTNFFFKKVFFKLDYAQYDAKSILTKAKVIISDHKIDNIIASGHPVSINYISTYLKIDLPEINLIQDYRDNWNDLNVYQFGNKEGFNSFKDKKSSSYKEFFTIYYSDYILNVSEDLTNKLKYKNNLFKEKLVTLTNGFDKDDFSNIKVNNDNFHIIYAGSLFNNRIEAVTLILDAIIDLNDDFINDNLKIILYSNYDSSRLNGKYNKIINKNIFFNNFIAPKKILSKISNSRYCLSINSKFAPYAFGTKIFDYMALNKKIIHISESGALYKLLENKNQYVSNYSLSKMKDVLLSLKEEYLSREEIQPVTYSEFSIDNLVKELEKLFRF